MKTVLLRYFRIQPEDNDGDESVKKDYLDAMFFLAGGTFHQSEEGVYLYRYIVVMNAIQAVQSVTYNWPNTWWKPDR